tara:strand:+ start:149 stop:1180 length:1032 start_codon:yes stop_codon:yes gene_type:complete
MSDRMSSIHVNPAKSTSEQHNNRDQELDYIFAEHSHKNEKWISESIADRERTIKRLCKQISGRKLQKNAEPIREAVVNLQAHHTMEDLQKLKSDLEKKWDFEIFQMYIHHDEGASLKNEMGERIEPKVLSKVNYHAHLVIDWQNKKTGKMLRYARGQMANLQTDVAESLGMKRGKEKTADKKTANERLGIVEYKAKAQEEELREIREKNLKALQEEVKVLEQKKNQAEREYSALAEEDFRAPGKEALSEVEFGGEDFKKASIEQIEGAMEFQYSEIERLESECRKMEEKSQRIAESNANWWRFQREEKELISAIARKDESIEITKRAVEKLKREIEQLENQSE